MLSLVNRRFARPATVISALLIATMFALVGQSNTTHAQSRGTTPQAATAVPAAPAATAVPAAQQPAAPVVVQPVIPDPIGQMVLPSNTHVRVCAVEDVTDVGGEGEIDLDALFASIGLQKSQVWHMWLVPTAKIVYLDDVSAALGKSATIDRKNVPNLPSPWPVQSGDFELWLELFNGEQWHFGIVSVEDGETTVEMTATFPDCDRVEVPETITPDPVKPAPAAPVTGFMDSPWKNNRTTFPLGAGLIGLVFTGFNYFRRRRNKEGYTAIS